MQRIVCLVILVFALAAIPAMADVQAIGAPISDWGQGFQDNESPLTYDTITIEYLGGVGGPLGVPALADLSNGWTETFDDGIIAIATGAATTNETWNFSFAPANSGAIVLEYWASLNGVPISGDTGHLGYLNAPAGAGDQGNGWWWVPEGDSLPLSLPLNASVPEPGSVSLLFAMLAGVGGLAGALKKRLT